VPEEARKPSPRQAERGTVTGWIGAALPGLALVSVAVMLFLFFGVLDAIHYISLGDFFTPDPTAAGGLLGLVGGAEGVVLSIVIVAVVFGIQTTSSRYSPRIIGIFTRNPLNALVLSFALASILYTFLVRSEVKATYTPLQSVTQSPGTYGTPVASEKSGSQLNVAPALSPDGSHIAFFSERGLISIDSQARRRNPRLSPAFPQP